MTHVKSVCQNTDRCARIEIAAVKVLNNIVEHAFADPKTGSGPDTNRRIRLICTWLDTTICLEIADNECALPGEALPEGRAADVDVAVAALPEGGFGWFLIRTLVSDIVYDRRDGRNFTTLWFA